MTGRIHTTESAAEYCGLAGAPSLYNLISQGKGPRMHKQGRRNAFYESDLDDWNRGRLVLAPAKESGEVES